MKWVHYCIDYIKLHVNSGDHSARYIVGAQGEAEGSPALIPAEPEPLGESL